MNMPPDAYKRQLGPGGLEMRALPAASSPVTAAEDGTPRIFGYGAVYNVVTTIGGEEYGFDEMFAPGAFRQSVAEADVRCMFNHEEEHLLGRTKSGSLRLADDELGVAYECDINEADPMAVGVHARVARGDVDGSSVWFRCIEDVWTYPDATNGLVRPMRVIVAAALIETGPVTFPAYEAAQSSARSLRPFDTLLAAAGVKEHRRATIAADILTDPERATEELRHIFASLPAFRAPDESTGPADVAAPAEERAAEPSQEPEARTSPLDAAKARLRLLEVSAPA